MNGLSSNSLQMGSREWFFLISLSLLWGGSFFFAEIALADLPPLTLTAGRVGFAALLLLAIALLTRDYRPWTIREWSAFLAMGVLNNAIPFSLIFWGQTAIASSLAAILNATTPLFTILLAHVLTKDERLNASKGIGIVLGFLGVVVMLGPDLAEGETNAIWPQIAILGAAVSYAFAGIFGRRFKNLPPREAARGQLTGSTLLIVPIAFLIDRPHELPLPSVSSWSALLALAFLSTALAYVLYFRILKTAGASNLLLVTFLVPVSAILLGAAFLDERLTSPQMTGMLLIAVGLGFVDGRIFPAVSKALRSSRNHRLL